MVTMLERMTIRMTGLMNLNGPETLVINHSLESYVNRVVESPNIVDSGLTLSMK